MATSTKTVNYTPENETFLAANYPTMSVEKLAETLGKTTRSVIAKLSRMDIYVKPAKVAKDGNPVIRKNELADAIGAVLQLSESEISGLSGSPKTALQKIFSALANSKPLES